ncbi:acetate/propionate family kinase [Acidithiobacillus sp. CV18-2]|uniref:Acetate kinase n=1 Tax=Igneacidithiobacillus copahuensis TaxID=2724909 RepID=A0AAE2YM49_9PROT|nr:acetate/propionate family kinase [Igneacidithiobacillus copahuensis]MBU2753579.1 acetate/propionate family kinase [Acidithiobacillus sp. CV18-3]MBU2757348.1 acetate/propionate family kinase [Acidithiobacillus sp. BN09-2]MBU2776073.1 acetate/propionate family kinase [Acidithiobacillus sp. CV18-2]MBU2797907.1 acetate/propionate family kinase [Acidithiobacillus sp. VAN18-2]MBU2800250.1 acetate/propionate family kinase [Acidithiobacillus sp. VAN18-4]UTV79751.1 acetate/propionate family kinase 
MAELILALNGGSSSLKFALYEYADESGQRLGEGAIERIGQSVGRLWWRAKSANIDRNAVFPDHSSALRALLDCFQELGVQQLAAIGHRVVSGGPDLREHCRIDALVLQTLRASLRFAPLHLPAEIAVMDAAKQRWPQTPQFACFDTTFHRSIPELAARYPLPRNLWQEGVRKYGFHGLSYEYICTQIPNSGRSIIAHLGNGASLAAVRDGVCVDTSMGLSPTGGVVMGTRCGDLDPGVLLFLLEEKGYTANQLERVLNHLSGLLGLSGISGDMQVLLAARNNEPQAAFAIDALAYSVRKMIGSFLAVLGGVDRLVFTGGIGEHADLVRELICAPLSSLGFVLDSAANQAGQRRISQSDSPIEILCIPTDEDRMIAAHSYRLLHQAPDS